MLSSQRNLIHHSLATFPTALKPKKSLGQHFLINEAVARRIVRQALDEDTTGNILEVGPGKGALTKHLLAQTDKRIKAIETDDLLAGELRETYPEYAQNIIKSDFLHADLDNLFPGECYSLLGNFPYNISSQILFKVEANVDRIPLVVGMFQKEVAERVVAGPGSKTYGILSVLLGAYYHTRLLFKVSPGSFYPIPKVNSAVIMLKRKDDYNLPCHPQTFRTLVKASFGQRRKMLRNSIKAFIRQENVASHPLMTRRPEQMSIDDYFELTDIISNQ